jgi:hypothetical protein
MGYIYLLVEWGSNPERFKIGITKDNVDARIKQLQTGSSSELVLLRQYESDNYRKIEKWLHRKYKSYSTDGGKEWFQLPDDDALNFIKECQKIDEAVQILKENNPFYT